MMEDDHGAAAEPRGPTEAPREPSTELVQVLPGLDVSLPLGLGYGLVGNSSTDDTQCVRCGNFEIGVAATYRTVWRGSLSFTHFIGPADRQLLADRDFIQFNVQRTF